MKEVKTKKHFNIFGFIVVLLILYLVLSFGYYILSLPIKNIYISGICVIIESEVANLWIILREVSTLINWPQWLLKE